MFSEGCVCITDDYEGPAVYTNKTVTARKEHECCECGCAIKPGQRYELARGLWDGEWKTFKTCAPCAQIQKDFMSCGILHGGLWGELREIFSDEDLDWLDPKGGKAS
jgi:hypothetical protein